MYISRTHIISRIYLHIYAPWSTLIHTLTYRCTCKCLVLAAVVVVVLAAFLVMVLAALVVVVLAAVLVMVLAASWLLCKLLSW